MRCVCARRNLLGNSPKKLHSRPEAGGSLQNWGIFMIPKIVIAGVALGAIVAFAAVSEPVQAGGCVLVSAKARGLGEAAASKRSQATLMHNINHWANKNKLATVHTGHAPTSCSKGKAGAFAPPRRRFALRTESSDGGTA